MCRVASRAERWGKLRSRTRLEARVSGRVYGGGAAVSTLRLLDFGIGGLNFIYRFLFKFKIV